MLHITLLGGFSADRDGRSIVLPTRKAAALLAFLAHRPGVWQSRDRAAALFWSRSAESQARGSLRQALTHLRKALDDAEGALIEASGEGLRLAPDAAEVDIAQFEAALSAGTPDRVQEAAALYRGPFLDGLVLDEDPFEDWRRAEAARIDERVQAGFGRLLAHHVETGDAAAGAALGERLLLLDPASEDAHRALMRLHLGQGAYAAAVRQYERCRAALESELGVRPSAETERLRREVMARPPPSAEEAAPHPLSVAVLPFANLSDDPSQGYFVQGFVEDAIRELARFRAIKVTSRHSSFVFAESRLPPGEIAALLGVRYLLTGSVRKTARSIRIGAELVEAESGRQVWAQRYDAAAEDLFEVQDAIARSVAGALAVRLDEETLRLARGKPLESLAAYDCWLRGVACLRQATYESHAEARIFFQRALDREPDFARAYAGLSLTHFNEWSCLAWDRWDENERKAFDYARRAVALDDADNVAQFILGRILLYRRDFERAERHLARAEALNPNDADIMVNLALAQAYLGDPQRGIAAGHSAMRLNPFHDDWYFVFMAPPHFVERRLDEAIALGLRAPNAATDVHAYLAAAHALLGRPDAARRHLDSFLRMFRTNITFGREPGPDEAARWLLRVNPYRRESDAALFLDGLARAGLPIPAGMASVQAVP